MDIVHFGETIALIPEDAKMVISAFAESIAWQIGSVMSTRLSNTSYKSSKKSCLKRVLNSRSGLE